jgi:hypothetical protein
MGYVKMHSARFSAKWRISRNRFHSNELRHYRKVGIPIARYHITPTKGNIMITLNAKTAMIALIAVPVVYIAIKIIGALTVLNTLLS